MDSLITKSAADYRDRAREVAEKYVRPRAAEMDREASYPEDIIKKIVEYGLMGVWIPEEYGGKGHGILDLCVIVEQLSRACGGVGVCYAVNALGSIPIVIGGSEEQKQSFLRAVAEGEKLIAFGLSEKEAGSDAGSLSTKAVLENGEYVINGQKKWTTNGGAASIYTVFCSTDASRGARGITAIVVEKGAPGFEFVKKEDLMGIRCVPVMECEFTDVRVPESNRLGEEGKGFYIAMGTLDQARPGVAAQALGLAQGALDLALEYTSKRVQFGNTIISNQGVQFMLADMASQVEAARRLVYASAMAIDNGEKNVTRLAAQAKVFATDVAMKVTTDAVQLFGGYGFCKDYPIEKYMRDAKITQIYEGTNQIQRIVIARALLREMQGKE